MINCKNLYLNNSNKIIEKESFMKLIKNDINNDINNEKDSFRKKLNEKNKLKKDIFGKYKKFNNKNQFNNYNQNFINVINNQDNGVLKSHSKKFNIKHSNFDLNDKYHPLIDDMNEIYDKDMNIFKKGNNAQNQSGKKEKVPQGSIIKDQDSIIFISKETSNEYKENLEFFKKEI